MLDIPTTGGRLMLVDMAGSENIEQAGQVGFEAKMQVKIRHFHNAVWTDLKLLVKKFDWCYD